MVCCNMYLNGMSNSNSNYQTQKLNKNNKNIHNSDYILAKNLIYHQKTKKKKKSCVIGEAKTKLFATNKLV